MTTVARVEHWAKEEIRPWHALPLFLVLAVALWLAFQGVALLVSWPQAGTKAIATAALFAGVAMGWAARREYDAD